MTGVRRRLYLTICAAAITTAGVVAPWPAAQAGEYPVLTTDGTICYERRAPGETEPIITVVLSEPSKDDVRFVLSTRDGSAVSPDDYVAIEAREFWIPAGELRVDIVLEILDDKEREPDEWFLVTIDSAEGAVIGTEKAEVIIKDGAAPPEKEGK